MNAAPFAAMRDEGYSLLDRIEIDHYFAAARREGV
jgi:hypothetical protein